MSPRLWSEWESIKWRTYSTELPLSISPVMVTLRQLQANMSIMVWACSLLICSGNAREVCGWRVQCLPIKGDQVLSSSFSRLSSGLQARITCKEWKAWKARSATWWSGWVLRERERERAAVQ